MAGKGRFKNGRFASGNTVAKGHGALARNINAVKTGEFMQFEEGETPYDRLRGSETELKAWSVNIFGEEKDECLL